MEYVENLNWPKHQNDPDNWIEIPEFNVRPQDVEFRGFAYPIYAPKMVNPQFRLSIWEMVKAVRSQARKRFKSLSDLRAAHISLLDRVVLFDKEFTTETYSDDEVFAFRYESIFYNLERCLQFHKKDKNNSIVALARAGSDLAEMMIEKPIDEEAVRDFRTEMAKQGALAKLANDPKQKDKATVRVCWDAWQKNPDDYEGKAEFAQDMIKQFPNLKSQPVIARWCLAWERKTRT